MGRVALDTIRVLLQVSTPAKQLGFRRLFHKMVVSNEWHSLFFGLKPALLRSTTYGSLRYGFYAPIKNHLTNNFDFSPFFLKVLSGSLSGWFSAALCNPTDLIKVRMQAQSSFNYTGLWNAFTSIVRNEGYAGLYTGVVPTSIRATSLAAAELSTYDEVKSLLLDSGKFEEGQSVYFLSSLSASFLGALLSNPFDFAKSRLMNQPLDSSRRGTLYSGMLDCMWKSVRSEGVFVLWTGFNATFARLAPNIIITFIVMEQLKSWFDSN